MFVTSTFNSAVATKHGCAINGIGHIACGSVTPGHLSPLPSKLASTGSNCSACEVSKPRAEVQSNVHTPSYDGSVACDPPLSPTGTIFEGSDGQLDTRSRYRGSDTLGSGAPGSLENHDMCDSGPFVAVGHVAEAAHDGNLGSP
jgi:hypothetical protein